MPKLLLELILLLALSFSLLYIGWEIREAAFYQVGNTASFSEAMKWIDEAGKTHEYYAERPEQTNTYTGSAEHNRMWVERYKLIGNHCRECH